MKKTFAKLHEDKFYILALFAGLLLFIYFKPITLIHGGSGSSMEPTFDGDNYAIGITFSQSYNRGDIIGFDASTWGRDADFLKRVVAIPGDIVELKNKEVYVNGQKVKNTWPTDYIAINKTYVLGEDEYFVLGDNGSVSNDSRFNGIVKAEDILYKIIFWI